MSLFGIPKAEIHAAIALLEQARAQPDREARQALARQAIPALGSGRFAGKLAPVVEQLIDDDELDRAVALLHKLLANDGGDGREASGRSRRQVWSRVALGLAMPLVIGGILFAVALAGGDKAEALRSLEQCRESQRALGSPIKARTLAIPPGIDVNDNPELARRALPVTGSAGPGEYEYLAEKVAGAWAIRHGALEVDGRYLMVVPCGGSVSESDAEGRLRAGYRGAGKARDVVGSAPAQAGDLCSVEVHPDPDFPDGVTFNCRVVVTCGGRAVYGATSNTGYVFCSARDGLPAWAADETGSSAHDGGDPMLRLDLPGHEVQLSDDSGWSFTIDLDGAGGS